jgi:hypothetical protein
MPSTSTKGIKAYYLIKHTQFLETTTSNDKTPFTKHVRNQSHFMKDRLTGLSPMYTIAEECGR